MMNVVVAILIEKYLGTTRELEEIKAEEEEEKKEEKFLEDQQLQLETGNILYTLEGEDDIDKLTAATMRKLIARVVEATKEHEEGTLQEVFKALYATKSIHEEVQEVINWTLLEVRNEFVSENRKKNEALLLELKTEGTADAASKTSMNTIASSVELSTASGMTGNSNAEPVGADDGEITVEGTDDILQSVHADALKQAAAAGSSGASEDVDVKDGES
jgi:hypothetical protein